jgi:hypothetical protein
MRTNKADGGPALNYDQPELLPEIGLYADRCVSGLQPDIMNVWGFESFGHGD